mmetsp:Transcript_24851/g.49682  ORF Transcript_24851/g.49682 Transcript_24851/m.49682 type:complete len:243 (+) Transcript_24851:590-1318(+)
MVVAMAVAMVVAMVVAGCDPQIPPSLRRSRCFCCRHRRGGQGHCRHGGAVVVLAASRRWRRRPFNGGSDRGGRQKLSFLRFVSVLHSPRFLQESPHALLHFLHGGSRRQPVPHSATRRRRRRRVVMSAASRPHSNPSGNGAVLRALLWQVERRAGERACCCSLGNRSRRRSRRRSTRRRRRRGVFRTLVLQPFCFLQAPHFRLQLPDLLVLAREQGSPAPNVHQPLLDGGQLVQTARPPRRL